MFTSFGHHTMTPRIELFVALLKAGAHQNIVMDVLLMELNSGVMELNNPFFRQQRPGLNGYLLYHGVSHEDFFVCAGRAEP